MRRSDFLNRFLILIGISSPNILINSCSLEEEDTNEDVEVLSEEEIIYQQLKDKTAETGNFLDGKLLYVDITNENYSSLSEVGNFVNDNDNYVLLLRKTEDDFKAFSNCCPHLGTSNRWSYSNGKFRCANHGNSYGTGTGFIANCSSNTTSGNLKQYDVSLNQDILTVDFDT